MSSLSREMFELYPSIQFLRFKKDGPEYCLMYRDKENSRKYFHAYVLTNADVIVCMRNIPQIEIPFSDQRHKIVIEISPAIAFPSSHTQRFI